jgi:hypothetical protein
MANPIQQAAVRRKVGYFAAIAALFTLTLFWRGKLDVPFSSSVAAARRLTDASVLSRAERLELRELDQGDPEIAGSAARLSLVGSRGAVITGLWWSAIEKQKRNEFHEFELLVKIVTRLQPNFITPWIFQSWNIAYNVSVENDKLGDMFFYIARGIELLAEGDRLNTKAVKAVDAGEKKVGSPDIRYQIGFYYQNKFGVSDKVQTLRSLMQLAAIAPPERALTDASGAVDPARFRAFCEAHPQLVRRLKTKLNCTSPEDVLAFLRDNDKIPSLFKPGTGERAEATAQFPALPPRFPGAEEDEYHAGREFDDRFDAFHAARAWFGYANSVVPPPKKDETGDPLPWATPQAGEYDPFLYRVPRQPTLIIFKISPPRAQTYLAERLAKEGWFDEGSGWSPDDRGGAGGWFGSSAGEVALRTPASSRAEYDRAWQLWDATGRAWGLILEPTRYARLAERSRRLPFPPGGLPPELSPEEMQRANIDPDDLTARRALTYYEQNRQMTNFPFFLDSTLAEKDELTVRARRLLYEADQARQAAENARAARLYTEGLARWREVLGKYPRFHRGAADTTEEQTYEYELALIGLLKEEGAVRARADRAADALRALAPAGAGLDEVRADLLQSAAEDETYSRVAAAQLASVFPAAAPDSAEQRAVRRVTQVGEAAAAAVGPLALTPAGRRPVSRGLLDTEFAWVKEASKEPAFGPEVTPTANAEDYWVRPMIRQAVRGRLGLTRTAPPPAAAEPATPAPGGTGQ